jgi:hypothetical protein
VVLVEIKVAAEKMTRFAKGQMIIAALIVLDILTVASVAWYVVFH